MKAFFNRVDKALLGSVTALVFFLLGFLWWLRQPSDPIPMWLFSVSLILSYAVCIVIYAVCSKEEKSLYQLPRVLSIVRREGDSPELTFLLEENELFSIKTLVTITYQNEDSKVETILGPGIVDTINEGRAQVIFIGISRDPQAKQIIKNLSNKMSDKRVIKIKPTITRFLIDDGLAQLDGDYYE